MRYAMRYAVCEQANMPHAGYHGPGSYAATGAMRLCNYALCTMHLCTMQVYAAMLLCSLCAYAPMQCSYACDVLRGPLLRHLPSFPRSPIPSQIIVFFDIPSPPVRLFDLLARVTSPSFLPTRVPESPPVSHPRRLS